VLLDAMLPRRNGFDVLRELRARGVGTPVLMLTARGQVADKVRGLKLGADDYVTKPFDNAELLARIEARLRPAQPGTSAPAAGARHRARPDHRRARGGGAQGRAAVDLSPREFHLLRYFVDHRGATLSRSELLQHVWGYDADVSTRTVDVHVAWLRRKLEDDPRNPELITTVHGMGYRLEGLSGAGPGPARAEPQVLVEATRSGASGPRHGQHPAPGGRSFRSKDVFARVSLYSV
jgi:two-component system alkaline phosphatase synthesis response regulator PhoP